MMRVTRKCWVCDLTENFCTNNENAEQLKKLIDVEARKGK